MRRNECIERVPATGLFDDDAPPFLLACVGAWMDLESVAVLQATSAHVRAALRARRLLVDVVSCRRVALSAAKLAYDRSEPATHTLPHVLHNWALRFEYHSADYARTHFTYTDSRMRHAVLSEAPLHPERHAMWCTSPRVLDLHGLRPTSETLFLVAHTMGALHHLCLDASGATTLGVLTAAARLRVLTLYGIAAADDYGGAGLGELTQIRELQACDSVVEQWFPRASPPPPPPPTEPPSRRPSTLLSPQIVALTCLPPRSVVALTLLTDADPSFELELYESAPRVDVAALAVRLPNLSHLDLPGVPMHLDDVARWWPQLAVCRAHIDYSPVASHRKDVPAAGGLRLTRTALLLCDAAPMSALDAACLTDLECRGYSAHYAPDFCVPMRVALVGAAQFTSLRSLRLHLLAHTLDSQTLQTLCASLQLLERLKIAGDVDERYRSPACGRTLRCGPVCERLAVGDAQTERDRYWEPLRLLSRLHTLELQCLCNVGECRLPELPGVVTCGVEHTYVSGAELVRVFPRLTSLALGQLRELDDDEWRLLASLPHLERIALRTLADDGWRTALPAQIAGVCAFIRERRRLCAPPPPLLPDSSSASRISYPAAFSSSASSPVASATSLSSVVSMPPLSPAVPSTLKTDSSAAEYCVEKRARCPPWTEVRVHWCSNPFSQDVTRASRVRVLLDRSFEICVCASKPCRFICAGPLRLTTSAFAS